MTHSKKILSPSGETMLSARFVAKRLSCAPDYVGKLCREGKLRGTRVGSAWFVEEESIREFEITRELSKAQRSEELSRQRREENFNYQQANTPAHKNVAAKDAFLHMGSFPSSTASLALGAILLFGSIVFAGAHSPSAFHQPSNQVAAVLAQIQSPFFGAQSITLELPTAGANNFFGNIFSSIAAIFKRDAVPPTAISAPVSTPAQPPVQSAPAHVSVATTTIVNNYSTYVTNPVTERTVSSASSPSVPPEAFVMILSELHRSLFDEIRRVVSGSLDHRGSSGGGGGSGSVTSVDFSGGTTGLTASGGPITSSGTFTLLGTLAVMSGGTGTSSAPTYGKLLVGNAAGGYDMVATSSLGIAAGGNPSWGNIIGTLSDQTDLQNALDTKLSLAAWFATTTDGLDEGTTNLYFTNTNAQTFLNSLGKGYFFSTTSANYWSSLGNGFSTTSSNYWASLGLGFSTTSANEFINASTTIANAGAAAYGDVMIWNGTRWVAVATSTLGIAASGGATDAFSTTSADYWKTVRNFFSTTSTDFWKTQQDFFSTTSANAWSSLGLGFSTTSADFWKTANNFFSTTSADYWKSANNFFSTTSSNAWSALGLGFSTTSTNYWSSLGLGFSTTSTDFWKTQQDFFSTTSAQYFLAQNQGNAFSTTSANEFINASSSIAHAQGSASGDILLWDGLRWVATATSSLGVGGSVDLSGYLTLAGWYATTTDGLDEGISNFYYDDGLVQTYLDTIPKGYFFSTTSADYWKTANNFFSTTSANAWSSLGLGFSTTSADFWKTANNFFSTTSSNYWSSLGNGFSTTSAGVWASLGNAFSTTSSNAWSALGNGFSTTSNTHWSSLGLGFSTTSTNYWSSLGLGFSTTSAQEFVHSSTTIPKTYTNNIFTGGNIFSNATTSNLFSTTASSTNLFTSNLSIASLTGPLQAVNGAVSASSTISVGYGGTGLSTAPAYGQFLLGNGTGYTLTSTSSLGLLGSNFIDWRIVGGALVPTTTIGVIVNASSTIGNGTAAGGLTIAGGATTTGLLRVTGTGTSTFASNIGISGNIIPATNDIYSLGSELFAWKDVFIGPGSLYVNGQKVVSTNGGDDVVVSADPTENIVVQTTSGGNIEFNPSSGSGLVQVKSDLQLTGGKHITTTDSSALLVPSGVAAGNITISGNAIAASNLNGGISLTPSGSGGTYVTAGNFGIATTSPLTKLDVYGNAIISGTNRYINFNDVVGTSGYGFRDNAGVLEYKNSSGAWTPFVSGSSYLALTDWYATTTDGLDEGTNNKYFTDERSDDRVAALLQAGSGILFNYNDGGNTLTISASGGGGGTDVNWTYFNGSGLYPATSTNQILIGGTSTSTLAYGLAKLGVIGGASIDNATTTNLFSTTASSTNLFTSNLSIASLNGLLKATNGVVGTANPGVDFENPLTFTYPITRSTNTVSLAFGTTTANTWGAHNIFSSLFATNASTTNATTTNFALAGLPNSLLSTNALGSVVATTTISGNFIDTTGNWSGTFDNREGSYYLANSFSTTSANAWSTLGLGFSTTSADFWKTANNFFSTTSSNYWSSLGLGFSTTSTNYWSSLGLGFSTTSANVWAGLGGAFSTTSQNYYASQYRDWNVVNGALSPTTTLGIGVYSSSTISSLTTLRSTSTNATTTTFAISGQVSKLLTTDSNGTVGGATVSSPLLFSGNTLSIQQGTASQNGYLSSADWATFYGRLSTTSISLFDKGTFFSTTSANYWGSLGNGFSTTSNTYWSSLGLGFSTTSANAWSSLGLGFSTTSANYFLLQNQSGSFSTTSANYWSSLGNGFSTTSAGVWASFGNAFSTTSSNAWSALGLGFSTTSTNYWSSLGLGFSTTSANVWANLGNGFSTTSENAYQALYRDFSVQGNGYLAPTTTRGVIVAASSTLGGGGQATGLTISGGATTTGNAYFAGNVGIGTTTPGAKLQILATSEQLRLSYDESNYAPFAVSGGGSLDIAPTGKYINITGTTQSVAGSGGFGAVNATIGVIGASVTGAPLPPGPMNLGHIGVYAHGDDYGIYSANGANYFASNVGIGTETPSAKLTTMGAASLFDAINGDSATVFAIGQEGATTTAFAISNIVSGNLLKTTTGGAIIAAIAGTDYATPSQVNTLKDWQITNGYLTPTTTIGIGVFASSTIGAGTQTGGLTISGGATTTGNAYFAGSVGVGTNPVVGNSITTSNKIVSGNSVGIRGNQGNVMGLDQSAAGSGNLGVYVNSVEAITIRNSNRNVGIGTTSPYAKLSVNGNAVFDQDVRANYYTATSTTIASTFPYASTTAISATTASTTNLTISSVLSKLLKTDATGNVVGAVAGIDYATPGGVAGLTWDITNGYLTPTSTIGILVTASSTIGNSTSAGGLTIAGTGTSTNFVITALQNNLLSTNALGRVSNTTVSSPLNFSSNILSIQQGTAGQNGYLSSTDWSAFNNKISSSSLSGASVISYTGATGVITTQAGTFGGSASSVYTFPGDVEITGNSTTSNATTSNIYVSGSFRGANLTSCSSAADKVIWNASTGQFGCATDAGSGGGASEINWSFFNGSGVRVSTSSNQVLIGATATSSLSYPLAQLGVVGGASIDFASTTGFYSSGVASFDGSVGIGTSSPSQKLAIAGGNILQTAFGNPTLASSTVVGGNTYGVYVAGRYAYVAAGSSGLKIVDISRPQSPALVGSYSTSGAHGIVVAGKYAYISDSSAGLVILDVSNPSSPALVSSTAAAGQGYRLALSGRYLFVPDLGNGVLKIVDVANPAAPTVVSSYTIGAAPYSVAVSGRYAYVGDQSDNSLTVLDIINPAAPVFVDNLPGFNTPTSIYLSGRYAYVTDAVGLHILDTSDPTTLAETDSYSGAYYSVQVAGGYAYLADATGNLEVVDVSDPGNILPIGSIATGGTPHGLFVSGKYAYMTTEGSTLKVIDINGTTLPAANIGSLESNFINVTDNVNVGGDIFAGGGINAGLSGIFSRGGLSVFGSTTLGNTLSVAGSTTLQNFSFQNATGSNATTSNFFARTASSTNLFTSNFSIASLSGLLKATNGTVSTAVAGVDYATVAQSLFSTTSANYWSSLGLGFSTTSANVWSSLGLGFSTTSENAYQALYRDWNVVNGALSPTTTLGIGVFASSTIGNGTLGLTVNGPATTTGRAYFGGNVGIGTTTPAYGLQVLNSTGIAVGSGTSLNANSSIGKYSFYSSDSSASASREAGSINSLATEAWGGAGSWSSRLAFTNMLDGVLTEMMSIGGQDGIWGVGIGTSSPETGLHLWGSASGQAIPAMTGRGLLIETSAVSNISNVFQTLTGAGSGLSVTGAGNVGIGSSTPMAKLSIGSGTAYTNFAGGHMQIVSANASTPVFSITGNSTADLVNIFDGSTEVFTILDGGNVGIGSTSPFATLSVAGNAYIGGHLTATGTLSVAGQTTLDTALTGLLKATAGVVSTATPGVDYATVAQSLFSTTSANYWSSLGNGFSTTSAGVWASFGNAFSTTSSNAWSALGLGFSTTSTNYYTSLGLAFSTTSSNAWSALGLGFSTTSENAYQALYRDFAVSGNGYLAPTTTRGVIVAASSTIGGGTAATGLTVFGTATSTNAAITGTTNAILSTNAIGQVVASTTIGTNYLTGALGTINTTAFNVGGNITITAASSTLLANNNTFSGNTTLAQATSTNFAISTISSGNLLKTTTGGAIIAAVAGTDYATVAQTQFSTTSANYWSSLGNGFSTTSAGIWASFGNAFSTTSSNAWSSLGLGFSTTSTNYYTSLGLAFSTTSSNAWSSLGLGFSTTSLNAYQALYRDFSVQGDGYLAPTTTRGIIVAASSTIGNGTATGGLTVSGNATTTGNAYIAGNVGIGTTSPSNKLHVEGSGATLLTLYRNTASSNVSLEFKNNTASWFVGQSQDGYFALNTTASLANAPKFVVTTGGNVGIGTSTPDHKFDVYQSVNSDLRIGLINPNVGAAAYSSFTMMNEQGNENSGIDLRTFGTGFTTSGAFKQDGGTLLSGIDLSGGLSIAARNSGGDIRLYTGGVADANQRMTILSTGNVGIGTTSPYAKLSVNGNAVFDQDVRANYYTATSTTIASTFPYASTTAISGTNSSFTNSTTTSLYIGSLTGLLKSTSGQVTTATPGVDYATVAQSLFSTTSANYWSSLGNGFSTTSTNYYTSLGLAFSTTSSNAWSALGLGFSTTSQNAYQALYRDWNVVNGALSPTTTLGIGVYASSTIGNGTLGLTVNGGATTTGRAYFGGNVGIGTSTPYSKLSLWGSSTGTNRLFELTNSASTTLAYFLENGTGYFLGNIGIGTTSPYAALSVVGEVVARNFTATSTTATSTFAGGFDVGNGALTYDFSTGQTSIDNLALGALTFDTDAGMVSWVDMPVSSSAATGTVMSYTAQLGGTPILSVYGEASGYQGGVIATSTRVGVGTTSPYATLSVVGQVVGAYFTATTTSDNTFPNLVATYSTSTNATSTNLFSTTASSTNLFTSNLSIASLNGLLKATNGLVAAAVAGTDYATVAQTLFSTTSANYWSALGNGFSTTSANVWSSLGLGFSTTSQNAYQTLYRDFSVQGNGYLAPTTTRGIIVAASSTIGDGTSTGGLTIYGRATTTGNAYFAGNVNITGGGTTFFSASGYNINSTGNATLNTIATLGSGNSYFTGNLGIGTTSPSTKLTVYDATNSVGARIDGGNFSTLYLNNDIDSSAAGSDSSIRFEQRSVNYAEIGIDGSDGNKLKLFTGGAGLVGSGITIDSSGNVGIGTSTPYRTLSVQGNVGISGDLGVANIIATGTLSVAGQTTLATSLTGLLKATSGVVSTATPGVDYATVAQSLFSTTSANYWSSLGNGFSTTSAGVWASFGNAFSTTSSNAWSALGLGFSTTSQNAYQALYRDFAVSGNGYLAPTTTRGIIVAASSTIGGGTSATGLTISGGATTTGALLVNGAGSFGDSVTPTLASRAFNLVATNAVLNISRISADINTASPSVELKHYISTGAAVDSYWDFFTDNNGFNIRDRAIAGGAGSATRFTVASTTGNVGIASTSPFAKLSVGGDAYIGGNLTATGTVAFTGLSSGFVGSNNGTLYSFASSSLTAASSTLLANNNTFSGNNIFSNTITGSISGNAGTATALAANGANCSSGSAPLGVDASGAVESCFDVWTEAENTSAAYLNLTSLNALNKGIFFSTTSANYWSSLGNGFSTTSAGVWASFGNAFSTTSSNAWSALGLGFSTTSANVWANLGNGFSTTSQNSYQALYRDFAVSGNGYLAPTTTRGVIVNASSTIGGGTQPGGLTISGGATTTGNAYFAGNVGVGTAAPTSNFQVAGSLYAAQGANAELSVSNAGGASLAYGTNNKLFFGNNSYMTMSGLNNYIENTNDDGVFSVRAAGLRGTLNLAATGSTNPAITFTLGNFERARFDLNGRLGIGTTTPGQTLTVAGSLGLTGALYDKDYSAGTGGMVLQTTGSGTQWVATSSLNISASLSGTTGQIAYFSGTNSAVGTSSIFISAAGNVGIGTTSPWGKLSINNSTNDTAGQPLFVIASSTASATTTQFIVTNSGKVGIGSSNPPYKLTIVDSGSGDSAGVHITQTSTGASNYGILSMVTGAGGAGTNNTGGFFSASGAEVNRSLRLATAAGAANYNIYADGTAQNYFAGNVGIGTTSPYAKLSVVGEAVAAYFTATTTATSTFPTLSVTGRLYDGSGTGGTNGMILQTTGSATQWVATSSLNISASLSGTTGQTAYFSGTNTAVGTSSLFIATSGNVGIGSTTPWAKLSINPVAGDGAAPAFAIGSSTATNFIVTNAGNVGIGTTTPSVPLYVLGTGASGAAYIQNDRANNSVSTALTLYKHRTDAPGANLIGVTLAFDTDNDAGTEVQAGAIGAILTDVTAGAEQGALIFRTRSTSIVERMRILGNGNVGIGTSSPFATLQVATTTGKNLVLSDSGAAANLKHWLFSSMGGNLYVGTTTDSYATSTPPALTISNTGLVGIGTASPLSNLHVLANANGNTGIIAANTDGGTSARSFMGVSNNNSSTVSLLAIGTGFTTSGMLMANYGVLQTAAGYAGLNIGTAGAGDPVGLWTGNVQRMIIDGTTGNVGVGTTSPYAKLSVHANNGETNTTLFAIASSTASATTTLFSISNTGTATIGDSSGTGDAVMQIAGDSNAWSMGYFSSDKSFRIASSTSLSSNVAFTISKGGNVGIGSTTPFAKLSVGGTGKLMEIGDGAVTDTAYAVFGGNARAMFGYDGSGTIDYTVVQAGGAKGINFNVNSNTFGAGTAMTIDASGNVGIGTTSPWGNLSVVNAGSGPGFVVGGGTGGINPQFVVNSSGNVGIGTASPNRPLVVKGSGSTGHLQLWPATDNAESSMTFTTTAAGGGTTWYMGQGVYNAGVGNFGIGEASNRLTILASSGNVGIASTTPWGILSVEQGTETNSFVVGNQGSTTPSLIVLGANGNGKIGVASTTPWGKFSVEQDTEPISFIVSNLGSTSPAFMVGGVNQNGRVGIGTSTLSITAGTTTLLMVGNSTIPSNRAVAVFGSANAAMCWVIPGQASISCTSDARAKKNITTIPSALGSVDKLRAVTYNWKGEPDGSGLHTGFIAQEVQNIFPELVYTDDNGMLSLNYAGFTPYLTLAVQELNLNLQTIASTTASSTPASQAFATSFWNNLFGRMTTWLASTGNGIANLFAETITATVVNAETVNTKTLCLDGLCVTRDELQQLLNGQDGTGGGGGGDEPPPPPDEPPADEPPAEDPPPPEDPPQEDPQPEPEPTPEPAP